MLFLFTGVMQTVHALTFHFSPSLPPLRNMRCQVNTQNHKIRRMRGLRGGPSFGRLCLCVLVVLSSPMVGPLCHHAVDICQWPGKAKQWSRTQSLSGRMARRLTYAKRLRGKEMNQGHKATHLLSQPSSTSIRHRHGQHTRLIL